MLEQVILHIHNRFEVGRISGTFTVTDGKLPLFLKPGQYFWIEGSTFNDGLHQHEVLDLTDETFDGKVIAMAIPSAVIELSDRIRKWQEDNGAAAEGPYQSESFGGYSYTKAKGSGGSEGTTSGWRSVFRSELNPWRKLS